MDQIQIINEDQMIILSDNFGVWHLLALVLSSALLVALAICDLALASVLLWWWHLAETDAHFGSLFGGTNDKGNFWNRGIIPLSALSGCFSVFGVEFKVDLTIWFAV